MGYPRSARDTAATRALDRQSGQTQLGEERGQPSKEQNPLTLLQTSLASKSQGVDIIRASNVESYQVPQQRTDGATRTEDDGPRLAQKAPRGQNQSMDTQGHYAGTPFPRQSAQTGPPLQRQPTRYTMNSSIKEPKSINVKEWFDKITQKGSPPKALKVQWPEYVDYTEENVERERGTYVLVTGYTQEAQQLLLKPPLEKKNSLRALTSAVSAASVTSSNLVASGVDAIKRQASRRLMRRDTSSSAEARAPHNDETQATSAADKVKSHALPPLSIVSPSRKLSPPSAPPRGPLPLTPPMMARMVNSGANMDSRSLPELPPIRFSSQTNNRTSFLELQSGANEMVARIVSAVHTGYVENEEHYPRSFNGSVIDIDTTTEDGKAQRLSMASYQRDVASRLGDLEEHRRSEAAGSQSTDTEETGDDDADSENTTMETLQEVELQALQVKESTQDPTRLSRRTIESERGLSALIEYMEHKPEIDRDIFLSELEKSKALPELPPHSRKAHMSMIETPRSSARFSIAEIESEQKRMSLAVVPPHASVEFSQYLKVSDDTNEEESETLLLGPDTSETKENEAQMAPSTAGTPVDKKTSERGSFQLGTSTAFSSPEREAPAERKWRQRPMSIA